MAYNAPWLDYAREFIGTRELPGESHNPVVLEFSQILGLGDYMTTDDTEHPWCAVYTGACLEMTGYLSTRKANAKSYLDWGQQVPLAQAQVGDIAVFHRGSPGSAAGHVGFIVGFDLRKNKIHILGGNQNNEVNIQPYDIGSLVGIRRPNPESVVWPLPESEILPTVYELLEGTDALPEHVGGIFHPPLVTTQEEPFIMTETNQPGTRNSADLPKSETIAVPVITRDTNFLDVVLGLFLFGDALKGKKTALGTGALVLYSIAAAIAGGFGYSVPPAVHEAILQSIMAYAGGGIVAKLLPTIDYFADFTKRKVASGR